MRSRILIGTVLLVSALAAGAIATSGDRIAPNHQSAIVYLTEPTLIGSTIVQGPVVFIHDELKMAGHDPCTTVRGFEPGVGATQELVSFHCTPTSRKVATAFTLTTRPNTALGQGCVLTEFQFAGDNEGHRVPTRGNSH
jgi:hypothetical protein